MGNLTRQFGPLKWLSQPSITFTQGTPATYALAQHVSNVHGRSPLLYSVYSGILNGSIGLNPATGVLTYSGVGGKTEAVAFKVSCDGGLYHAECSSIVLTVNSGAPVNQKPVWTTVPTVQFVLGVQATFDLRAYAHDPEGDPVTYTLASGAFNPGVTLSPDGLLHYDGSGIATSQQGVTIDCSESNVRLDLAELPEFAFVTGFAESINLGPWILDSGNRWQPGDLGNTAGWAPRSGFQPVIAGALPSGVTYTPTTAVLRYDGLTGEASSSVQMVFGTQARTFRVRVLTPTILWGRNADTYPQHSLWTVNPIRKTPPTDTFFSAMQATGPAKTDAKPNVVLVLGGDYSDAADGNINGVADRLYLYLIGEPGNRPILRGADVGGWSRYNLLCIRNFEHVNLCQSIGNTVGSQDANIYISRIYEHTRNAFLGIDSFSNSNQEGDGGGTSPPSLITATRKVYVFDSDFFDAGGSNLHHLFYLHGRPGGEGHFNNVRVRGGKGGSTIKSTMAKGRILNCSLWALQSKTSPSVGDRAAILVDWINPSDLILYNNDFVGAYNPSATSNANGTNNGLVFIRNRRELVGCDVPAYPEAYSGPGYSHGLDYDAGVTSMLPADFSRFGWTQGFDALPATFKNAAFWAAVAAYDRTNVDSARASPYAFKHYFAHNRFEWVDEPGGARKSALRNDGTTPGIPPIAPSTATTKVQTHAAWTERAVDFLVNNDFIGWEGAGQTVDDVLWYQTSEFSVVGDVTTGVMKWPRTGTRLTNPTQYPQYLDVGPSNDFLNTGVPAVTLPVWFPIGGTGATATVLSSAAAGFSSGFSPPLAVPTVNATDTNRLNPESVTSLRTESSGKRTWHWASKAGWDSVNNRVVMVHGPHIELDNPLAGLMSVYDEASNQWTIGEDPMGGYTGAHLFDTFCIDAPGRRWFKWTNPYTPPPGFVQPQLIVGSLDLISTKAQIDLGGSRTAIVPRGIIPSTTTAPALDVFPGLGLCLYHRDSLYLIDVDAVPVAITLINGSIPFTGSTFHHIGHYHPGVDGFIFGGGSYQGTGVQNLAFHVMHRDRSITRLDNSPVCMSVNTDGLDDPVNIGQNIITKACAAPVPNSSKSVFFHNNGNVYTLDTTAATGLQWQIVGAMDANNASVNDRWACAIPTYDCVMMGHYGLNGTSTLKLFRLP